MKIRNKENNPDPKQKFPRRVDSEKSVSSLDEPNLLIILLPIYSSNSEINIIKSDISDRVGSTSI